MKMVCLLMTFLIALSVRSSWSQCLTANDDTSGDTNANLTTITDFGLDLFRSVFPYEESKNFFFSPYSIWNALALAYFGSGGQTEEELGVVLNIKEKVSGMKMWRGVNFIYDMRQINESSYTFRLANRAYFDEDIPIRECMEEIFKDEIKKLNFTLDPSESANTINSWVSEVTKNRINNLVTVDDVSRAKMVLANAAFFKGTWLYQFKPSDTTKEIFYTSPTEISFVNMMKQKGNFLHGVSEVLGAHVLELPYTGDAISMIILLPPFVSGNEGFTSMVRNLNTNSLTKAMENMWRIQVEVSIPKFKLSQTIENELIASLTEMGVPSLFDATANLTGFSSEENLSVGKSIHKAFVEVNEEGTEAAAATALISFRVARPISLKVFKCNHPFLFLIYDKVTSNVLFMGAYKRPVD